MDALFRQFVLPAFMVVWLVACAPVRETVPGSLAAVHIAAPPLAVSEAAADVLVRYSYSVSSSQYLNFRKTGNSLDPLAATEPATLVLNISKDGAGSQAAFSSLGGIFRTDELRAILQKIKLAAESR